uniref:Uncharacterized protein n=1 Tax=Chromera velia CCMP2878 TaxID=1169474 RepID=A0A0G4HQD8_9ALVE|eukprot:Cvel_7916.t1-p1 / transcript=Cvel_7916.t1 / gene=Cvel_7916 / organism=Chromera_velia_CCMP2878 / gene_product=hypothetical protein / transcript_product=hypothetical protein / location=Cvel_scaffold424:61638-63931(+) / protein_length=103 / sequence_SO=supercontig / SO=protein_coding / is_pseudo=false
MFEQCLHWYEMNPTRRFPCLFSFFDYLCQKGIHKNILKLEFVHDVAIRCNPFGKRFSFVAFGFFPKALTKGVLNLPPGLGAGAAGRKQESKMWRQTGGAAVFV